MHDAELLILDELNRLAPADDVPAFDWDDVRRRVQATRRRPRPARLGIYAFAAVVVVWIAAPAFGLQPPFLDFFSSKSAPQHVAHSFEVMNVVAPRGMSPGVIAGQTRRVTVYHLRDGKAFPLFVAPRRSAGFCFQFGFGGGCTSPKDASHLGVGRYGAHVIAGSVFDQQIDHLELQFKDGTSTDIPLLWVSPPINAGFYLYDLTSAQRTPAHAPVALVALDAGGHVLASERQIFAPPPLWADPSKVSDPAHKRVILRSGEMSIAISPAKTGGDCWWLQRNAQTYGSGCAPPRFLTIAMAGGLNHGTHFTSFSAQLRTRVARVELRFQDGTRVELQPVDGFVLYNIPSFHWPRGHRLTTAVAFDPSGRELKRQSFDPLEFGTYPCTKEVKLGAGQTACP